MRDSGFKETLKNSVDIVRTIHEYLPLKQLGRTGRYLGLCPFHNEKTPSFNVNEDKQFYKCFGCGKGGDVFSFVMEIDGLGFYEAMKLLAERNGIAMPKLREDGDPESRKRATIQELHEVAAQYYREKLLSAEGEPAREYLRRRGTGQKTAEEFLLGYSDTQGGLTRLFQKQGVSEELMEQSGLVMRRDGGAYSGGFYDRFRGRLMFPIWNESAKVIAFGARALVAEEQPKYLNSPETAIYRKSHVLYNLQRAKEPGRRQGRIVLVEGYMDVIGVHAAGVKEVVASCGTALRPEQVKAMRRHVEKVVVNFDGDSAGENAAEKSIQILLEEGVQVRVCSLPGGKDPDEFAKEHGAEAYRERLEKSPGYFYWLAQRARTRFDMKNVEGRMEAFRFLLPAIQKLPDKLERLAVVNDVARELGVDPEAVLEQFRKSVREGGRRASVKVPDGGLPDREKLLIRLMLHHPEVMRNYVDTILGMEALESVKGRKFLDIGLAMLEETGAVDFQGLQGRLSEEEANLLAALFSSDTEGVEKSNDNPAALIQSCLASLQSDYFEGQLKELRQKVAEAERRGEVIEAMELMRLADQAERRVKTYRQKS